MKRTFSALGVLFLLACTLFGTAQADTPGPTPTGTPGGEAAPQVVGGNPASVGEYPWQVALIAANTSNPYPGQFCGGSLIDATHVLTAGHCVVQTSGLYTHPAQMDVLLGSIKLSNGPTNGVVGQRIDVSGVFAYPGFARTGPSSLPENDLAILRLATPATLNSNVGLIDYVHPADSALFAAGVTGTLTGWGKTSSAGSRSDDLLEAPETIVANGPCNTANQGLVSANMLCAGPANGTVGTCPGDSGGPFIVPDGGGKIQAGIVSWGYPCAVSGRYDVYTRLANFAPWVDAMVNPSAGVYLPLVLNNAAPCTPGAASETSNINNAQVICSGQVVAGTVNSASDIHDVFQIYVQHDQKLSLSLLAGIQGDAQLRLFSPTATDVIAGPATAELVVFGGDAGGFEVVVFSSGIWFVDVKAIDGTTFAYDLTANLTAQ